MTGMADVQGEEPEGALRGSPQGQRRYWSVFPPLSFGPFPGDVLFREKLRFMRSCHCQKKGEFCSSSVTT